MREHRSLNKYCTSFIEPAVLDQSSAGEQLELRGEPLLLHVKGSQLRRFGHQVRMLEVFQALPTGPVVDPEPTGGILHPIGPGGGSRGTSGYLPQSAATATSFHISGRNRMDGCSS